MNLERIDDLLDAYLLGELSREQAAQLQDALQSDPVARAHFAQGIFVEAGLHQLARGKSANEAPRSIPAIVSGGVFNRRRFAVAAMVVTAISVFAAYYFLRPDSSAFARVTSGDVWVDGKSSDRITEGAEISVSGPSSAVIQLADGSVTTLDPDTQMIFSGRVDGARQVLRLSAGGGQFHVMQGGGQFRIETTAGTVTVLGTEFTALLRSPQSLFVMVTTGSVRVDASGSTSVLSAGHSATFGPQTETIPLTPSVADTVPPKSLPAEEKIAGVADGFIHSWDTNAGTFVLGSANETRTTFTVGVRTGDKTTDCLLLLDGKLAKPETAIKPGRKATVTYVRVGDELGATKVEVTTGVR